MKKVSFSCNTDGRGFWSRRSTPVQVMEVTLSYLAGDKGFGELRAKFANDSWDVREDGLIYTDPHWMKDFRQAMKKEFQLSDKAIADIDYSEQGMQGNDFVSMDVGENFLKEWL